MVEKIFEIIDYFNPDYYIIENPKNGKMKEYINDLIPYYDVDYCMYSDFGYRKTTRFWTNIQGLEFNKCNHKKHKFALGHLNHGTNLLQKYRIPEKVIKKFFNAIIQNL